VVNRKGVNGMIEKRVRLPKFVVSAAKMVCNSCELPNVHFLTQLTHLHKLDTNLASDVKYLGCGVYFDVL
jgi:hypothetical protein